MLRRWRVWGSWLDWRWERRFGQPGPTGVDRRAQRRSVRRARRVIGRVVRAVGVEPSSRSWSAAQWGKIDSAAGYVMVFWKPHTATLVLQGRKGALGVVEAQFGRSAWRGAAASVRQWVFELDRERERGDAGE